MAISYGTFTITDIQDITITSTSVTYQEGLSGTVKPTGTWETDVPTVAQGNFLWTKTVVNYSDNSYTESYSVSRNAVNGTNGISPTVSSTVTEYVQTTSGTTTPTSGWDTTPPSAVAGRYMWTKVTVTYSDGATSVSYTVSKNGANGSNGINTATVYLYKKGDETPSAPSGNTTYTFANRTLTGTLDNWSQRIPSTGNGDYCYVTAAVASSNGTTDIILPSEWSTPIQFNGVNGNDGTNGLNQATVYLYKRGTNVTKPTTSVLYTFATNETFTELDGWTRNIPEINGDPCWVISTIAVSRDPSITITGDKWSDPVKLVEDGNDGNDAYTIILTNENHTFAGNTTSAIASEIECNVIAYKGATQIAATIGTITGQPTGMTTSLLNNGTVNSAFKVTVTTSMVTKNGVLNVPITVDGKTFTKEFTYALTLDGEKGDKGDTAQWYYGELLTHTSGTATLPISQTEDVAIGAMYLNTKTGICYKCTAISDTNATWTYAGNITDGIEIGGRNLIINTLNPNATAAKRPKFFGQTVNTVGRGTALAAEHGIRFTTTSDAYCYMYMGFTAVTGGTGATLQGLTIGETYTFSCDFTCKLMSNDTSSTIVRYFRLYLMNDSTGTFTTSKYENMITLTQTDKGVEKSNRFEYTFTIPEGITKFGFMFRPATTTNSFYATGDFIEFKNMKLEKGNKATDWTPAQEDINTEINNAEENAKKVATNYLANDESGIMVANMENGEQSPSSILSGNNVFIDSTSVNIRDGQKALASFGTDGIQIGLDNETRIEQDYHSWKMIDKDDNVYALVSDLRDENGEATVTETAKLNEATQWSETNFEISSIISVTVNGEAPESYQKMLYNLIKIQPQPTDGDVVVVTYTSQSPQLKAYTFGKRIQDSNIGGYSFVEGVNNVASGYTSHAEGNNNTSSGEASHVEGVLNTAQGYASHAQNFHTTASSDYQTAIGKYNVDDANNQYAFIIGNGELNPTLHETDYSNALAIGWNGSMEIGGGMFGTLVENSDPAHELPTRTSIPLFKTVSWSGNNSDNWNNVTIAKNSGWSRSGFNIYQKGYRVLGVVGFGVYPALTNPANTDWCIITRCYTWFNSNLIMEDGHVGGDTLDIYVWNQHQSQSAKVRIFVRILYIAESAFAGV